MILHAAEQHRSDMIVMATHGRSLAGELMWGSYTRQVIAGSPLPVLVVR